MMIVVNVVVVVIIVDETTVICCYMISVIFLVEVIRDSHGDNMGAMVIVF